MSIFNTELTLILYIAIAFLAGIGIGYFHARGIYKKGHNLTGSMAEYLKGK